MDLDDDVRGCGRVKTIYQIPQSQVILDEMQFIMSVLELFCRTTRYFQSPATLIQILYNEMSDFILRMMQRCLSSEGIGVRSRKDLYKEESKVEEWSQHRYRCTTGDAEG